MAFSYYGDWNLTKHSMTFDRYLGTESGEIPAFFHGRLPRKSKPIQSVQKTRILSVLRAFFREGMESVIQAAKTP